MRLFNASKDYETVASWWTEAVGSAPPKEMLPEDSTFLLEYDGTPMLCVTVYKLNTTEFALVDNLVANPALEANTRKMCVNEMQAFLDKYAKILGVKKLMCMAGQPGLSTRYQELGYVPTMTNVTTLIKEIA